MAEDEDGVPNKKSAQNSNNGRSSQDNEQNRTDLQYFPRLLTPETDEAKCNNNENGDASPAEAKSSSSKSTGATRKEENPFSFRHFLKRDLSLPGNSTYENTGARPKVYASTVQHSPTSDAPAEPRPDPEAKDKALDGPEPRASDNTSSSSSVEVSFSVVDNSESKHNLYADNSDAQLYRPGLEPLGMPSLPDFVQDHILVEQAYLNSNGPISVDLDNLPDFTFNTNYNAGSSSSLGRRNNSGYGGGRGFYEPYSGASTSGEGQPRVPLDLPLDLPPGAEGAPAPNLHLSLDLTESVNPADRRNMLPRSTFPLDLPTNAGAESMRLPDFLPVHPGRTSPEPEHEDASQRLLAELERTRSELAAERGRRVQLEQQLARHERHERNDRHERHERHEREERQRAHSARDEASPESPESESTVEQLRAEVRRLKAALAAARAAQAAAAGQLRAAAAGADASLRELVSGVERLRALSAALRPAPA